MWTDEREATLRKLWAEGLSASEIAKHLGGVTRNAVIGKVHRLGLQGRASPHRPVKRPVRTVTLSSVRARAMALTRWRSTPPKPKAEPKPKAAEARRKFALDDPCSLAAAALLGSADEAQRRRDGYRYRGPVL